MEDTQEDLIDFKILNFIDPPSSFPPSPYDVSSQIQAKFYSQCLQFLKTERKLYECSKKIENRLAHSISDSASLDERIRQRADKLDKISRQLHKINNHYVEAERREQFLAEICKFINMEQARSILLQNKIANEQQYIAKLKQINELSQQIKYLNSDLKIILQIKQQISTLLQQATNKLIKGSLSQSLINKITSEYSDFFTRDPKVANIFITSLTNQRLNFFRVALNPLINNINYVQNVSQLYEKICDEWISMIQQQIKIFCRQGTKSQIKDILKQTMQKLIAQEIPKIERGIYKVKNIVDVSRIRSCLLNLKAKLDECGQSTWDPLPKVLVKTLIILQQKLEQGAEQLEIAKYNIYSLVSYVPIRQHLELIKLAKSYDPKNAQIDWERGFKKLADSRDPSKQPNNKSLLIFNLNIWYLYSNVMKSQGEMKEKADKMIKDGTKTIVNLNITPLKKQYQQKSIIKLLDLCADLQTNRKNLNAEINLLGHQRLRASVEEELATVFIQQIYKPILIQNNLEGGLSVTQVVELGKKQKVNLNKYGKSAENLRVYTVEEMRQLIS